MALCLAGSASGAENLTVLLSQPPVSLNPRAAVDAIGQKLGALIFGALTRIDADLNPRPDLAAEWKPLEGGRIWKFRIRPDATDQSGLAISPVKIAQCLEEYRVGKPTSVHQAAISGWESTAAEGEWVVIRAKQPDVYLPRNVSLLRYFRVPGSERPCTEPQARASVIGSGPMKPSRWESAPERELVLLPAASGPTIRFLFIADDNTRVLKLLGGEADAALNALSLAKTRWLGREHGSRFEILEREATTVGYLAFNLRDPMLSRRELREAIARALPRQEIVRHKLFGFGQVADSLVSPLLPEAVEAGVPFDPSEAERILDKVGLCRDPGTGIRLRLRFKTTPVREGLETALMVQEALRRIGIELTLDVVEPAVWLASVRKGNFQMIASRWVGVADGSILYNTLRTGRPQNRWGYSDPEMDRLLDEARSELAPQRRKALLEKVQRRVARDLPYFPLWYWSNALVLRRGLGGLLARELSLSGALEPLMKIR